MNKFHISMKVVEFVANQPTRIDTPSIEVELITPLAKPFSREAFVDALFLRGRIINISFIKDNSLLLLLLLIALINIERFFIDKYNGV